MKNEENLIYNFGDNYYGSKLSTIEVFPQINFNTITWRLYNDLKYS